VLIIKRVLQSSPIGSHGVAQAFSGFATEYLILCGKVRIFRRPRQVDRVVRESVLVCLLCDNLIGLRMFGLELPLLLLGSY
jgi:hypothetical protein